MISSLPGSTVAAFCLAGSIGAIFACHLPGQTPASAPSGTPTAPPRFQVATIKPSLPEESRTMQIQGNRFATTDTSLVDLLKYAYGLQEQEIVGGPKWLKTQKFDLVGDPETQARPSSDEFKKMVQNLLADRFHLTAHHETRDLSVYEIVVAKSGPKLTKSTGPPDGIPAVGYSPGRLVSSNATLADSATFLQRFVTDRPVFDGTGITGKYDCRCDGRPMSCRLSGTASTTRTIILSPVFLPPFRSNWD